MKTSYRQDIIILDWFISSYASHVASQESGGNIHLKQQWFYVKGFKIEVKMLKNVTR